MTHLDRLEKKDLEFLLRFLFSKNIWHPKCRNFCEILLGICSIDSCLLYFTVQFKWFIIIVLKKLTSKVFLEKIQERFFFWNYFDWAKLYERLQFIIWYFWLCSNVGSTFNTDWNNWTYRNSNKEVKYDSIIFQLKYPSHCVIW